MSDLKDELERERREKEWAETWKPQAPGDALIGTLEGYDRATTDFGEYRVAHVRNEEGVLKGLWLMHTVLQDEWEEAGPEGCPQIGDRVGAMYHGKRSGDTYDYHMWTVKVDRTEDTGREEASQKSAGSEAGGSDRPAQESSGHGSRPDGSGTPDFDGDELYGEPAADPEDVGGKSTLDDPNGELPF